MNAEFLVRQFKIDVDTYNGITVHQGTVVGVLKKACGNDDARYRQVLKALSGKTSSKELSQAELYALHQFVKPYKPDGGKWQSERGDELVVMCNSLINAQDAQTGQLSFLEYDPSEITEKDFLKINEPYTVEVPFNPEDFKPLTPKEDDEYEPPF